MSKLFNKISISLLLAASVGGVYANPGQYPEWRDGFRSVRSQRADGQRDGRRNDFQVQQQDGQRNDFRLRQQAERRRAADARGAPVPGAVQNPPGNNSYGAVPEAPQRPGRMSPEERRALRRQINEAGRDIYAVPR